MAKKTRPVGIRQALLGLLDAQGMSHLLGEQTLRKGWAVLLGPRAAPLCELVSLQEGLLRIRVQDAVWRQELHFQRQAIITKANALLGGTVVKDVIFG